MMNKDKLESYIDRKKKENEGMVLFFNKLTISKTENNDGKRRRVIKLKRFGRASLIQTFCHKKQQAIDYYGMRDIL